MGSKVYASCECGLHKVIKIGGGMMTFKFDCYFPCLCEDCNDIVNANLMGIVSSLNPTCPDCYNKNTIPYNNPAVIGDVGNRNVVSWYAGGNIGELELTNGNYKCPKCKEMTLNFSPSFSLWD